MLSLNAGYYARQARRIALLNQGSSTTSSTVNNEIDLVFPINQPGEEGNIIPTDLETVIVDISSHLFTNIEDKLLEIKLPDGTYSKYEADITEDLTAKTLTIKMFDTSSFAGKLTLTLNK